MFYKEIDTRNINFSIEFHLTTRLKTAIFQTTCKSLGTEKA